MAGKRELSDFEVEKKANQLRMDTLEMCIKAETGHVTSSVSCADILATLYHGGMLNHDSAKPESDDRDRFILSKGQASPILYATLADRGFFPKKWLDQFVKGVDGTGKDAPFGVHLQGDVPGVEFTTGSLGCGIGYGAGVANAMRMDGKNNFTYVLLGDAELYEGSNWEVAMNAANLQLGNLVAIVDRNKMGVNDYTEKLVPLEPLKDKWEAFGWKVREVDGHSVKELRDSMKTNNPYDAVGKPYLIIANTIKGRGIASMTNKLYIHGLAPKGEEAKLAIRELREFTEAHEKAGEYNDC